MARLFLARLMSATNVQIRSKKMTKERLERMKTKRNRIKETEKKNEIKRKPTP